MSAQRAIEISSPLPAGVLATGATSGADAAPTPAAVVESAQTRGRLLMTPSTRMPNDVSRKRAPSPST
eukprot:6176571-Alexandrium_andersonii.AAC.1